MTRRGQGPRPKDPSKRARTNAEPIPVTKVKLERAPQPELPAKPPTWIGDEWPHQTLCWWDSWQETALTDLFTRTDWDFLLDTAIIHAAVWNGDLKHAAELRLRVAKFGATTEDRARLRIQAMTHEPGDEPQPEQDDIPRYGEMRVVADGA